MCDQWFLRRTNWNNGIHREGHNLLAIASCVRYWTATASSSSPNGVSITSRSKTKPPYLCIDVVNSPYSVSSETFIGKVTPSLPLDIRLSPSICSQPTRLLQRTALAGVQASAAAHAGKMQRLRLSHAFIQKAYMKTGHVTVFIIMRRQFAQN